MPSCVRHLFGRDGSPLVCSPALRLKNYGPVMYGVVVSPSGPARCHTSSTLYTLKRAL